MNDALYLVGNIFLVLVGFYLFNAILRPWWHRRKPLIWTTQNRERVDKPWGHEDIWASTDKYVGKLLHIKAGHSLSKQYHRHKDETILIISGNMELTLEKNNEIVCLSMVPGDNYHIEPFTIHRMTAITDVVVAEVSTPELADVVRLEDKYGRA